MIEKIVNNNEIIAIVMRDSYEKEGVEFVTPNEFSQQLAYMKHPKGHKIIPHFHNEVPRIIKYTQEVLIIKKGRLRVDFYDVKCKYINSIVLNRGDVILLCSGGHGFEVIEDVVMVEIKQGPYAGEEDKTKFESVNNVNIKLSGESI